MACEIAYWTLGSFEGDPVVLEWEGLVLFTGFWAGALTPRGSSPFPSEAGIGSWGWPWRAPCRGPTKVTGLSWP